MKGKNKWVTIYLPNGTTAQYCTTDLGDSYISIVDTIECEPNAVNIAYKEDGKVVGETYVRMPYHLQMF